MSGDRRRAQAPRRRTSNHGQGAIEYALILGLIAVVVIAVVTVVGRRTASGLCSVGAALGPVDCPPFTEYTIPTPVASAYNMAIGSDNAVWFTEQATNKIGRLAMDGSFREYPDPAHPELGSITAGAYVYGISAGPAGTIWFTETTGNKIGKITIASGLIQEYSAGMSANAQPRGITLRAKDNALWFTEPNLNKLGKIDPVTNAIVEYGSAVGDLNADGTNDQPWFITSSTDDNLWFGEYGSATSSKIGRFNPAGPTFTEFATPAAATASRPNGLVQGPDNAIWFVLRSPLEKIDRIPLNATSSADIMEYPNASSPQIAPMSFSSKITLGPDGALWFTEYSPSKIGRMTTDGTLTNEYSLPHAGSAPVDITLGPDNAIWFTEGVGNRIGRLAP